MAKKKGQKDKQQSTKHYTENKRSMQATRTPIKIGSEFSTPEGLT